MLLRIALRNVWLHRVRALIVGGLIAFGTLLVIVGNAVLDAVEEGIERGIVHSVAGHLQVYSDEAKDELALFGKPGSVEMDIGQIDDFAKVKKALLEIDNVEAVVPQGISFAIVFGRNTLDIKLEELRQAVSAGDAERISSLERHVRQIVEQMAGDFAHIDEIADMETVSEKALARLDEVAKGGFWADFAARPLEKLEVLENEIAPMQLNASMLWLRYLGTDPQQHAKAFELFELARGEMIPEGERGFMLNEHVYERWVKHRVAMRFDRIKAARDDEGRHIADDEELQSWVRHNVNQHRTISFQIDPDAIAGVVAAIEPEVRAEAERFVAAAAGAFGAEAAAKLRAKLDEEWGLADGDISGQLPIFLDVDDESFDRRYAIFYEAIAPEIILYNYPVGSNITITALTRAGYVRSVNVKIYGTFRIKSMEKSALAGAIHMIDLVSFRELFGFATPELKAEVAEIKEAAEIEEVDRDDAEAALFGGDDADVSSEVKDSEVLDQVDTAELKGLRQAAMEAQTRKFTREELEDGPALNAAIFLKDRSKLEETRAEIEKVSAEEGLHLRTSSWQEASGLIGQFTAAFRVMLNVAIAIIFIVALVIINNSMVMATMERVREIGTIRAIGGQRRFVLALFMVETLALGIIFGTLGAALGAGAVLLLGWQGIPAFHEALYLLFGGPALHPTLAPEHLIVAFAVVVVVALLSTFYPAMMATRIAPVTAMQAKE